MDLVLQYQWHIFAALAIFAALLVLLMVWRTLSPRVRGRRGQRLNVSEYYELDKMRRLVLVRRDNIEHLVMIGGPQDIVIESGISSSPASFAEDGAPRAVPLRTAPRPPVFGDRRGPALTPVRKEEDEQL